MRFGMPAKRIKRAHSPTYSISPYVAWSPRFGARGAQHSPLHRQLPRRVSSTRCARISRKAPRHTAEYLSFATVSGNRVELTWTVSDSEVGEKRAVQFTLTPTGRFHRHSPWDDGALFYFHVNPPRDD
ncbi:hypothetical protein NJB18091_33570 [Mycobacterium marinum]|nr:hypothetical protein NJB18091_33570 [Mycobacterium marinum]